MSCALTETSVCPVPLSACRLILPCAQGVGQERELLLAGVETNLRGSEVVIRRQDAAGAEKKLK